MTIADLFVNIGVKGDGKAKSALGGMKSAISDIGTAALTAVAATTALVYALEQVMSNSMKQGTELQKFGNLTGLSTDKLQRWQYMARQSGESAEDMAGSIKNVQDAMSKMLLGKGAPEGLGVVAKTVGFDSSKARDTFYVMDKLREYARTAPPDMGNQILKSFGLSEDAIQTMRTSKVELDKIKPSNLYSAREIAQLAAVDRAWGNLWNTMKMMAGHGTAKFGMDVVKEISSALNLIVRMGTALTNLSTPLKVIAGSLGAVALVAAALASPFIAIPLAIAAVIAALGELEKWFEGKKNIFTSIGNWGSELAQKFGIGGSQSQGITPTKDDLASQRMSGNVSSPTSTTINQNLNFQHDGKDPIKLKDAAGKGVREAVAQMPSRVQVN